MSMEVRMSERPLARYGATLGVAVLAGAVAGGVSGIFGSGGIVGGAVVAVATGVAMAVGLWSCTVWWRGLDEAAQEAHKWAWWWGSTFGLAIGGVMMFTLVLGTGDRLLAGKSPQDLVLTGAAIIGVVQIVGYGIAWAVWWLRRR